MTKTFFKAFFTALVIIALIASCATPGSSAAPSRSPAITYPLAIRMAEQKINRFVTTPQDMRDRTWESHRNTWDSIELISQRELQNGDIEYVLRFSVDQGTRIYTTDQRNNIIGPKNITVASFGPLGGPNENLSAYNAQRLIDQSKEWYTRDQD